MVKLNKIYTRTGDNGSTGLTDGSRVAKHSPRPQAYGSVDELNSSLGLVYFFKPKSSKNKKLKNNEDVYTELKKLNELLELGIITQEEYVKKAEELKKVILD